MQSVISFLKIIKYKLKIRQSCFRMMIKISNCSINGKYDSINKSIEHSHRVETFLSGTAGRRTEQSQSEEIHLGSVQRFNARIIRIIRKFGKRPFRPSFLSDISPRQIRLISAIRGLVFTARLSRPTRRVDVSNKYK